MFEDQIKELADSVFKPIQQWILSLSWLSRASILCLFALMGAVIKYPEAAEGVSESWIDIIRVARADSSVIPMRSDVVSKIREARDRLSETVTVDLLKRDDASATAWTTAQAVVALHGLGSAGAKKDDVVSYIRTRETEHCACWTEKVDTTEPCTFISGWVMTAFAELGVPVSADELKDVFAKQNSHEGWWSTSPLASQDEYASTYTTAWIIIGLSAQKRKGLIELKYMSQVNEAIYRAATWLLENRIPNAGARWKPYPNLAIAVESESISGLVLHSLHVSGVVGVRDLDKDWLDNLPDRTILASDADAHTYADLRGPIRDFVDNFAYLTLPWTVVATDDAYANGDIREKSKALGWLERTIADKSVLTADANNFNWWRAELLFGVTETLRHV